MTDENQRRGPASFFGRRQQRPASPAVPDRPAAAARPPRHPVAPSDGTLSPADSFSAQLRESMILPDDLPRSLSIGQQSGDAADARPDSGSASHRRRSESDTHPDRRDVTRSERPDRAAGRSAGERQPARHSFGRSLTDTVRDVLEGGGTEQEAVPGGNQRRSSCPHDRDADRQRTDGGQHQRVPSPQDSLSLDEDPLLSFAPAPAAEGPATPVMARLLGRRADERAAARSAAAADTPPTLPNVGAATRGMAAAAAASTAGQQPGPQQDGSSAADGDAASAPYLQGRPTAFASCADVVLIVEGRRLPVHSQILASQSAFFANMWTDIGLYGEEAPRSGPLVLEKGLEGRSLDDVLLWLDAVYKQVGPATLEDARRLVRLADEFQCDDMTRRCDGFLAGAMAIAAVRMDCAQGPETRYVDWAALGERCRLCTFLAKFECIIIDDWQMVRRAANLTQLPVGCALRIANGIDFKRRRGHRPSSKLVLKWQSSGDLSSED